MFRSFFGPALYLLGGQCDDNHMEKAARGIKGPILWKFIFRLLPVLLESDWIKLSAESHDQLSSGVAGIPECLMSFFSSLFRLFAAALSLKREQNNHSPVFSPLSTSPRDWKPSAFTPSISRSLPKLKLWSSLRPRVPWR